MPLPPLPVAGLQRSSTLDFPGRLSCVVFTRGCDMNCFYCHNRELLDPRGDLLAPGELAAFLEKRRGLLDGVVISGGEPTLSPALPDFLRAVRALGYQTKLDTNGQRPDVIAALLRQGLLDYTAVDWKAARADYLAVTGRAGWERARETLALLAASGAPYEARTTLYPGLGRRELRELAEALPPHTRWRWNFYRIPERYLPRDSARVLAPSLTPGEAGAIARELRAAGSEPLL